MNRVTLLKYMGGKGGDQAVREMVQVEEISCAKHTGQTHLMNYKSVTGTQ
jgi:hypothetical protein